MSPSFAQLGVPDAIIRALADHGITEPFAIQAATIADAMEGRDVCGRAPTGSGKTLAFGIPLVATVAQAEPRRPRALVLAPTRELAEQISTELGTFAGPIRIGVVYGGVGYGPQMTALRRGVDILVACPGRLEDLIEQREVDLSDVDQVVLDEADRMADMGFMPAVRRLLDQTDGERQTVLFSATLDGDVAKLTRDYQYEPVRHEVGEETPDIRAAHHRFWKVTTADRNQVTADAVDAVWPAIIFCRTRHGSDRLARKLGQAGIEAATIHGGRSQNQRTRALDQFSRGRVQALVATDVAARGIHVDGVASVIHFDPPEDHKAYVHRSGRTARAGETGVVLSLVQPQQVGDIRAIQRRVDLDEPVTEPDAGEIRALSPGPTQAKPRRAERSTPADKGRPSEKGRTSANKSRRSKKKARSRSGAGRTEQKPSTAESRTAKTGGGPGKKQSGPKKGRHPAKPGNRKARRAHLQPGYQGERRAS